MPSCGTQNILRHNALNILTAAPKTSRFIAHRARFDVFAHPSFAFGEIHLPPREGFEYLHGEWKAATAELSRYIENRCRLRTATLEIRNLVRSVVRFTPFDKGDFCGSKNGG